MSKERDSGTGYLLWALCLIGICGIHRFYLDKPVSAIIWFVTGGLCGLGQLVDLFILPGMVREKNLELAAIAAQHYLPRGGYGALPAPEDDSRRLSPEERLQVELSRLASQRGGHLTVNDGVVATGRPHGEVQEILETMVKEGHIDMDVDPNTGAIVFYFREYS